jgi:hypothetical protein
MHQSLNVVFTRGHKRVFISIHSFYEACILRGVEDQPGHVVVDEPEDHAEGDAAGEEEEGPAVARLVLLRRVQVTTIKTPNPKGRLFLKIDL